MKLRILLFCVFIAGCAYPVQKQTRSIEDIPEFTLPTIIEEVPSVLQVLKNKEYYIGKKILLEAYIISIQEDAALITDSNNILEIEYEHGLILLDLGPDWSKFMDIPETNYVPFLEEYKKYKFYLLMVPMKMEPKILGRILEEPKIIN